jgi:hypothetical protein
MTPATGAVKEETAAGAAEPEVRAASAADAGGAADTGPSPCGGAAPEAGLGARLATARSGLASVVADLDPARLTGADAIGFYESLVAVERLVVAGKTLLAPRIEASGVWRDGGHRSAAVMLASLEGVATGQAQSTLSNGQRLGQLPGTEAALRTGVLSGPKVTELTGAGILAPQREHELLAGAGDAPLGAVRERCRRSRATSGTEDPRATVVRIRAARHFSSWTDAEGAFCYQGRDTLDRGAQILSHLNRVAHRLRRTRRAAGDEQDSPERAVRADAFYALITARHPDSGAPLWPRSTSASGPASGPGPGATDDDPGVEVTTSEDAGDATTSDDPGVKVTTSEDPGDATTSGEDTGHATSGHATSGHATTGHATTSDEATGQATATTGDRPPEDPSLLIDGPPTCSVMVRVDLDALLRGHVEGDECCEIDNQGPIPVAMARDLANDSFLRVVFHQAGDIRAVHHLGRTINQQLRTALVFRDRTCVVPGCGTSFGLEIDHIVPFAEGGPTTLDNLALLCHHHHFLKTYEGWVLSNEGTGPNGTPRWRFEPQPPFGQEPGLGMDTDEARSRRKRDRRNE